MTTEEAPSEDSSFEDLAAANRARRLYLAQHGAPPPVEQQYLVSLLEYVLLSMGGPDLVSEAKGYHELRVAPILDRAVERITENEEQARAAALKARLKI